MSAQPVIVMNESILDMIEATFGISKNDVLQAIAISKVGYKHIEQWNTEVLANTDVLPTNIRPVLPNSRILRNGIKYGPNRQSKNCRLSMG